jgi:hypothetical protein
VTDYEIQLIGVYNQAFELGGVVSCLLCVVLGMVFVRVVS